MIEQEKQSGIKQYADGWINEREGTEVPGFLKLAIPLIALFGVAYVIVYMNGETTHSDRGTLVRIFNEATQSSGALMYAVGALAAIYGIIVAVFAFRKSH